MAAQRKRSLGGKLPDQVARLLSEALQEAQAELPEEELSPVEVALSALTAAGLTGIVATTGSGLAAALVACNPALTLAEAEDACDKLEDLAIMILAQSRGARHEIRAAIEAAAPEAPAVAPFGEIAIEALPLLEELGCLDEDEAELNREAILRGAEPSKRRKGRR